MTGPSIFIVEDEAIVASDIRETIISLGYTAAGTAKTGELALEKIKQSHPDLVLMDIHLAGEMDGIDTAGKVHALYDIPVIYLTAYADKVLLDRAKITEPYGYVVKPYDERELHSVIEMALYKHRVEREIKKRDAILFAVSSAVEWLLRVSKPVCGAEAGSARDFNASDIRDILEPIGFALDAGSIGIFRVGQGEAGHSISMIYEWGCPEYHSCLFKPELRQFTFSSMGLSHWEGRLMKGEIITAVYSTLQKEEQKLFNLIDVRAGVIIPIFIHDTFFGFIGFFDLTERTHSPDEIEALRITANLLGAAIGSRQSS